MVRDALSTKMALSFLANFNLIEKMAQESSIVLVLRFYIREISERISSMEKARKFGRTVVSSKEATSMAPKMAMELLY